MIKQLLQVGIILAGFASMPSWGIAIVGGTYNGTNVGGLDDFLIQDDTLANSNPATETDFVKNYLTSQSIDITNLTFEFKVEPAPIFDTDTANVFASDIATTPSGLIDFFIVKNSKSWALFGNNADKDWAVFDATTMTDMNVGNDTTISHLTVFSNGGANVPEPSIVALLGIGLLGMVVARRRTKV